MLYPVTGCNGEGVAALPTDLFTVDAARAASRHDRVNAVRTAAISPIGITGFKPLSPKSDRRHGVRRKCDSRTVQPLRMGYRGESGRAAWRERGWQYGWIRGVAGS